MIIMLICMVLAAGVGAYWVWPEFSVYDNWDKVKRFLATAAAMTFGAFIGGLIGLIISMMFGLPFASHLEYRDVGTRNLAALKDNPATSGAFFLGSGYVDEDQKYFAIVETDKGLQMQSFDMGEAYIHERPGQPKVVTREPKPTGFYCKYVAYCEAEAGNEYHFYIPPGSVDQSFKINMEAN